MSKTLKIFLIILVFGIIILGGTTVQAGTVAPTVTNATELQTVLGGAVNAEVLGNTVKLLQNITLEESDMEFASGTVILDLNGKTIILDTDDNFFEIVSGDFTVKDSTNTTGKIEHRGENEIFKLDQQGKLTIENGIFIAEKEDIIGIAMEEEASLVPTVIIENGTFIAQSDTCLWGYAGNITIHDGKFESLTSDALYFDSDDGNLNVTINNCEVISYYESVCVSGGNLTIHDGSFVSSNDNALYIDNYYNEYGANNKIIINGGTYSTSAEDYSCVYIDMYDENCYPMDVIINGGTFTARENAYNAITLEEGNLEINGGTFISKSDNCIEAYNGILEVNGGNFSGYWTGLWYDPSNTDVILKGGKYEALATVSEDNYGGIATDIKPNVNLRECLAPGYEFYEDATIVEYDGYYCTKSLVTVELRRYNISIDESKNGTVTLAKNYAIKNEKVTVTVTPIEYYKLKSITVTTKSGVNVEVLNNKFTMPEEDVTIKTEFELAYEEKIITKAENDLDVSIKGTFSQNPKLVVTKIENGNSGYNSLISLLTEDQEVLGSYDISITDGIYKGELEITFEVDQKYEGKKLTIYHKLASGEIETKTATVKDGKLTITVNELSPFMLVADKEAVEEKEVVEDKEVKDITPKTGNDIESFIEITMLITGLSIAGIIVMGKKDKMKS